MFEIIVALSSYVISVKVYKWTRRNPLPMGGIFFCPAWDLYDFPLFSGQGVSAIIFCPTCDQKNFTCTNMSLYMQKKIPNFFNFLKYVLYIPGACTRDQF
jgi:hypothetical protein